MAARILIVDDETNARQTLCIGLRLEGFEVMEAADGPEALAQLEAGSFDLAVVDLMMPRMNGLDLARRMRFRHPDVLVVMTSAYHLSARQIERAGVGAVGFVPKPCELDQLAEYLRRKLDGRSSSRALGC